MLKIFIAIYLIFSTVLAFGALAQDKQELEAERIANAKLKGEHPLFDLMKTKNSSLKSELKGIHPRVYLTQNEIDALKAKIKTQPEL
jgi:hypothetical protein